MQMTQEQLEFAISQYLDGTLMPLEKAALEEQLGQRRRLYDVLLEKSEVLEDQLRTAKGEKP